MQHISGGRIVRSARPWSRTLLANLLHKAALPNAFWKAYTVFLVSGERWADWKGSN
jgi:hypothetical protein